MRSDQVKNLAVSAVFVAVSVVLCFLASLFPSMSLAITAISGFVSAIVLFKCGYKYAFLVYLASSILNLFLVPNKECVVYYIVLFGHYPILNMFNERICNKPLKWFLKIVEANILYLIVFFITSFLLGISESVGMIEFFLTMLLFNITFVLYDICLRRIMALYISKRSHNHRFR